MERDISAQTFHHWDILARVRIGSADILANRHFITMDISVRRLSSKGHFLRKDFLSQRHFDKGIFRHRDVSALGHFGSSIIWQSGRFITEAHFPTGDKTTILLFMVPKFTPAKMSMCQNIPVPKCSHAATYLCRNIHDAEISQYQNVPVPKCPCAEKSLCRNVPMIKCPCRNDLPKCQVTK